MQPRPPLIVDEAPLPTDLEPHLLAELSLADDGDGDHDGEQLFNAVGLRLESGRVVDYDAGDASYDRGERVVCEGAHGLSFGTVVVASRRLLARGRLPRVLRRASPNDLQSESRLRAREVTLRATAEQAARSLKLPVKIIRAEAMHGGQRFVVYFASEERFPYREFLRALAQTSRERIELRQLGARDAARLVGGVGPCGLQLCCNTFLSEFAPVSIRMAKDQGMALNPQKVAGVCGRLLCCLVYEEAFYRAQRKLVPRPNERVMTPQGPGKVRDIDVLAMQARVQLDDGEPVWVAVSELTTVASPRGGGSD